VKRRRLEIILVAAALLRAPLVIVAVWSGPERLFTPDSEDYVALARSLAETNRFERDGRAEVFRTPGYPFFLLSGMPFGNSWWLAVAMVQVLLDVTLVYLTIQIARRLFDDRVALWAGLLQAVSPLSVAYSVRILSESLFAFLLGLAIVLLIYHFRTARAGGLVGGAGVAAVACYVRAVGLLFVAILLVILLGRLVRDLFRRAAASARSARHLACACGLLAAVLTPWVVRNGVVGGYVGFSTVAETNLFRYEAPAVLARVRRAEGMTVESARRLLAEPLRSRAGEGGLTQAEEGRLGGRLAREVLFEHFGTWVVVHLKTSAACLLPGITDVLEVLGATTPQRGTLAVLQREGLIAAARHYFGGSTWLLALCVPAVLLPAVKYVLIGLCAIRWFRRSGGAVGWMLVLTAAALLLVGGPASTPRFRVPVEPLLSVGAAAGLAWMVRAVRRRKAAA
jgi:4-amino-4-deoxy-L-arabinose transferase-like glycosyltransferase